MKMKHIFTGIVSLAMTLSSFSVWGMSAAVYEIQPRVDILSTISTASRENWQVVDDSARYQISGDVMRVSGKNGDSYTMEALAGQDLYAAANQDGVTKLSFSVEVQAESLIQIEGLLKGKRVFQQTSQGTGAYETLSVAFELLPTDTFFNGTGEAEDFKIVFTGTGNSYFKNMRMRKEVEKQVFEDVSCNAGTKAEFDVSIYATETGNATVVLALLTDAGEVVLNNKTAALEQGVNVINIEGTLPESVNDNDGLVVYVKAENGDILSERKLFVGSFYTNGVNILGSDLKVKDALLLFGAGEYLIEFDAVADSAQVTLGNTIAEATGGVCELELTDAVISALTADAALEFSQSVSNVTLRKTAD